MSYASAGFEDASDMQPLSVYFDVGGHGSHKPYSDASTGLLDKHTEEIRGKVAAALGTPPAEWKRRIRDFIAYQNTEILNFLNLRVEDHTTLGPGEALLRRFGNPQVTPSHPSVRDFVLDTSGEDVIADISEAIEHFRGQGGLKDYIAATQLIYSEYRLAGEELLRQQAALDQKLDRLNKIQSKIATLFEVEENEEQGQLIEAAEKYLKRVYENNHIAEEYRGLIAAYRRFTLLRSVISMTSDLKDKSDDHLCSICMQDPVTFVATPCGHCYCGPCLRKQGRTCCICRGDIKDRVKLFL